MRVCGKCQGACGWYTAPNGDTYLSDPGGLSETWQRCPECHGVGVDGGDGKLIGFPTLGELIDRGNG